LAVLRSGRYSARLPAAHTAQGRNLRRWMVQLLVAERIVAAEAQARGLARGAEPRPAEPSSLLGAMETGGVGPVLLQCSWQARALRAEMAAGLRVPESEVASYYQRNSEEFFTPERRWVSRSEGDRLMPMGSFQPGELVGTLAEAVFATPAGSFSDVVVSTLGAFVLHVDRVEPAATASYQAVAPGIRDELWQLAAARIFCSWLDQQYKRYVRLMPGFEHPCDPAQPDAVHRH
jgi:[acyl-carrier-protein] S-malonyltransferase